MPRSNKKRRANQRRENQRQPLLGAHGIRGIARGYQTLRLRHKRGLADDHLADSASGEASKELAHDAGLTRLRDPADQILEERDLVGIGLA